MAKHEAIAVNIYRDGELKSTAYSLNDAAKFINKGVWVVKKCLLTGEKTPEGYTLRYLNKELESEKIKIVETLLDNYIVLKHRNRRGWHAKLNTQDLNTLRKILALLEDENSAVYSLKDDRLLDG